MSLNGLFFGCFLLSAQVLAENPFEKAAHDREVARQRAFDRGQKTALPAAELREAIGRLPAGTANAVRSADGQVVHQGPPSATVYHRVMETRRHFKHDPDPNFWNANDTFIDSSELAAKVRQEAERIYPDLAKPNSAFAMRFAAMNRWIDSRQPPLARDYRRMLLVCHMVSLELAGRMAVDSLGLAQVPISERMGLNQPTVLKTATFEIQVRGEMAVLPEGLQGKVKRGRQGSPDLIEWQDAAGVHHLSLPQQFEGQISFSARDRRSYQRFPLLNGDFRVRFF
jgi:hypothetical protein